MRNILVVFFCCFSLTLFAQIDNGEESVVIPAVEAEKETKNTSQEFTKKQIKNTGLTKVDPEKVNGLATPKRSTVALPKKEFSMFETEEFGNPGELYNKQIKKHTRYTELEKEQQNRGSTTTQYFGDYKTKSKFIRIVYRDYGAFDGDHIRVFINEDVVKPHTLLMPSFTGFTHTLVDGINKIDFFALDTGQISPNTAEFKIVDDQGNTIATNKWNLAKGVSGSIVIIKE